jgi:hypothetical protein
MLRGLNDLWGLLRVGDEVVGTHSRSAAGCNSSRWGLCGDTLEGFIYLCCSEALLLQEHPLCSLSRSTHLQDYSAVAESEARLDQQALPWRSSRYLRQNI